MISWSIVHQSQEAEWNRVVVGFMTLCSN